MKKKDGYSPYGTKKQTEYSGVRFGRPPRPLPETFLDAYNRWKAGEISKAAAAKECEMPFSTFRYWVETYNIPYFHCVPHMLKLWPLLLVICFGLLFRNPNFLETSIKSLLRENKIYLGILCYMSLLVSTFIHEASHVIIARNNNAVILECGVKVLLILSFGYVKISGLSNLDLYQRINIYKAGIEANMLLATSFYILFNCIGTVTSASLAVLYFSVWNFLQAIINLETILNLDGYKIMTELFQEQHILKISFGTILKKDAPLIDKLTYLLFLLSCVLMCIAFLIIIFLGKRI